MRFACLFVLVSGLAAAASAADVNGKWKLELLGDPAKMPKAFGEVILDLKTDGKLLGGAVHAGNSLGDMTITDGKADGDRISFTVVSKLPWRNFDADQLVASGYSRLRFSGRIDGDKIKAHLLWDSVMISGNIDNKGREYEMAGERVR